MEIVNVSDYEAVAKQNLPKMVFDYYTSSADDQWNLKENRHAFERIRTQLKGMKKSLREQQEDLSQKKTASHSIRFAKAGDAAQISNTKPKIASPFRIQEIAGRLADTERTQDQQLFMTSQSIRIQEIAGRLADTERTQDQQLFMTSQSIRQ